LLCAAARCMRGCDGARACGWVWPPAEGSGKHAAACFRRGQTYAAPTGGSAAHEHAPPPRPPCRGRTQRRSTCCET
jgi:hypothetical protein